MKITELSLKNVKSFLPDTRIQFNERLNIFIGPNSGGKSNVLEILQGIFNDLIFTNVNINRNNEYQKSKKPYTMVNTGSNQQFAFENTLDRYFGRASEEQRASISLCIEENDIKNIDTIRDNKGKLLSFESQNFVTTVIENLLNSIDLATDYKSLVNEQFKVVILNQSIQGPNDEQGKPFGKFFNFLKTSNVFANFINFYNFIQKDNIVFSPYLTYISPHRTPINIRNVGELVNLSSIEAYDTSFIKQVNQTQTTSTDVLAPLLRFLTDNYSEGNSTENEKFKQLINSYLGLDFKIELSAPKHIAQYEVSFFRQGGFSPKLSSGEKEFLYLISIIFLHHIDSGIILIDEPELHLHPRWQKELINLIKRLIKERNLQIQIVTHSPNFVSSDTLKDIVRVYKKPNSYSEILLPDVQKLSETDTKDAFKIVTATNNEKVFFADKVVLVEGDVDRIVFESVLELVKTTEGHKEIIEVVDVAGKANFSRYETFLDIWKIPRFTITDLDFLTDIGSKEIKDLLATDFENFHSSIIDKSSKDGLSLLRQLKVISEKTGVSDITDEDFVKFKELFSYLSSRFTSLITCITPESKNLMDKYIEEQYSKGLFILKKGEIEDYFNVGKLDITGAVKIREGILDGSVSIDNELLNIFKEIVKR